MNRGFVAVLLLALLSASCSERQLYEGIQNTNKSRCHELPSDQRERCLDDLRSVDYDEYRRELEKIRNTN